MIAPLLDLFAREARRAARFSEVAWPTAAPAPRWATENVTAEVTPGVRLRLFRSSARRTRGRIPVLVVTPQVNHSYIADFSETQSLVRTLLAAGVPCVGVTDWADPPVDQDIAGSLDDIGACAERLGPRVHLVGLCQGGWQAAILAARSPGRWASLTIAAAPIDTHAGATLLHAFTLGLPMAFFEGVVDAGGGVVPGKALSAGFDLLKPFERFWGNDLDLYLHAHDEAHLERVAALRNWYRLDKGISGRLYLEVVRELFQENRLAKGTMRVGGRRVDLGAIEGPVHLVAGSRDHITPPEQVWALEALAPRARCRRHLVDAGHIGVFMGRTALAEVWPSIGRSLD